MAKKRDNIKPLLNEGDYFSATVGRKKIRGIVGKSWDDRFFLANSKEGSDVTCEDEEDGLGFSHAIYLAEDAEGTEQELYEEGVTNYTVLKDRRQKAIIERDKLPTLDMYSGNEYKVAIKDGYFIFGCGAVELTRKQIEGYLRFRAARKKWGIEDIQGTEIQDLDVKDIEIYLEYKKSHDIGDGKLYTQVVEAANGHHDEDDLNDIYDEDIKALLKYADHLASS